MGQQWYYSRAGQQLGPVDADVLRQLIAAGQVNSNDLVWREGMANWQPAANVPDFFTPAPGVQGDYAAQPYAPYGAPASPGMLNYRTAPTNQPPSGYAGFWLRFCAAFIDGLIVGAFNFVIGFVLGFAFHNSAGKVDPGINALANILGLVVAWLYEALQESSAAQATLGKRACGIYVTDTRGRRISFARATGRHFAKIISAIILLIGYIMAAFTERKQALHDQMADTLVVRR